MKGFETMLKKRIIKKMFFAGGVALCICALMLFGAGCRSDRSATPVTPLHIGPYLLPFGSEPATTYGLAAGLWCENADSCGIFIPFAGTTFEGTNYGVAISPICSFTGNSDYYGIAAGILSPSDDLIPGRRFAGDHATQNGISIFPFEATSRTNGISIEIFALEKEFNGIDIGLCSFYEGKNNGLQVIVWDCNGNGDGTLNGCQIGWLLRSSVRGVQIGGITYNPCESDEICLDLGVLNWGLKHGIQVGGINRTGTGNPLQIGVFNFASDSSPFQIGLLNYNENGFLPFFPFVNFSTK